MQRPGTVLVVGASRGIGLELARQYAAAGWNVHATTRTPDAPGPLGEVEGAVQLHHLDVRNSAQRDALVSILPQRVLDVVIHNAGINRGHPIRELMEVNAVAPIAMIQALLNADRIARLGKVVLITSQMGARRGDKGRLGDYGESKAALNDEFRLRSAGWGAAGVIAIVMHPGWVRTDMGGGGAPLGVEESVAGIRRVVAGLSTADHGRFLTWDGREHRW